MRRPLELAIRMLLIAVATFAAFYSFVWSRAEALFDQKTQRSAEAALRLAPQNPSYAQALAEAESDDEQKVTKLNNALALNPFDARLWVDLGLLAELRQKDLHAAEQHYLKAAEIDRMYMPRWTLANFYFRQNDPKNYFRWAHEAIAITPYDPFPIFDQIWSISQDPARNAAAIPNEYRPLYFYLAFLLSTNRKDFVKAAAERAVKAPIPEHEVPPYAADRAAVLGMAIDALLVIGDRASALHLWDEMRQTGLIKLPAPAEAHPLSNRDFTEIFLNHGFDWKDKKVAGVSIDPAFGANELRILFNGLEPESCVLLEQAIPVEKGARYRITWEAMTNEGDSPRGVGWRVYQSTSEAALELPPRGSASEGLQQQDFEVPHDVNVVTLSLEYHRPLGEPRLEDTLLLRRVAVDRL